MRRLTPCWLLAASLSLAAATARAEPPTVRLDDEQALEEERHPDERFRESSDPHEAPDKAYFFAGAGFRFVRLPTWLMKAYTVEGTSGIGSPASFFGELAYRKNGFQVLADVGFMKLDFDGPFRLKSDPVEDTEWMKARFKLLAVSAAITWSTSFTDWFQLEYGLEAGFALMFGDLTRTEAVKRANGKWDACTSWASLSPDPTNTLEHNPLSPNPSPEELTYCEVPDGPANEPPKATNAADEDGAHYHVKATRGLRNGGVPRVLPLFGPRLSLRFKPVHQVVLRVDVPLPSIPFGFVGGLSVQYGF